jgi:hypothetical protein
MKHFPAGCCLTATTDEPNGDHSGGERGWRVMGKPTDGGRAGPNWQMGQESVDHSHYAFGATTDVLTLQHEIV